MKQFLKENAVLAAGIALPLVLIAIFYVAGVVARAGVADPKYDMVFAGYYGDSPWQIGLEKDALTIRCTRPANSSPNRFLPKPRLYLFDHRTMTVEPLAINYDHMVNGVVQDPAIDELNTHVLSAGAISPDGYRLVHDDYDGGIFSDLFGYGGNRGNRLRKQSRAIPLTDGPPYFQRVELIAWVGGKKR